MNCDMARIGGRNGWVIGCCIIGVGAWATLLRAEDRLQQQPPAARTVEQIDELHGTKVSDPYRWLENPDDAEVQGWLDGQGGFTRRFLDRFPERAAIKSRLESLYETVSISAPQAVNGKYFFYKREGNQNHSILYVRKGSHTSAPTVLIDPNGFSDDGTVALDWTKVSPKGRLIAYGRSAGGDEKSTLFVKNVDTGELLSESIPNTRFCDIAWLPDETGFYYTRYPSTGDVPSGDENYNRKIFLHMLGQDWKKDELVVGDLVTKEEMVEPSDSTTHEWLFLSRSVDWTRNDLYHKPINDAGPFRPLAIGLDALTGGDFFEGKLYINTNYHAPRYRIVVADPKTPDPGNWKDVIPQQEGVITGFDIVDRKLVLTLRENAYSRVMIYDLDGKLLGEVKLPTLGSVTGLNGEWDGRDLFFSFSSFAYPPTVFRYDMKDATLEQIEKPDIDVDVNRFETVQKWFKSKDGTRVPMFIVSQKGVKLDGQQPTLLYGYGGFNISMTPSFRKGLFVWLEKGGVFAVANIRGGGEFGAEWHHAGRRQNKQNVFDDFIAAAEALIELKYTSPDKLAISGGSNGGLLVGACLVQRPELYRAVLCSVPLLDMLRYHNFEIARLWIPEYGSPDEAEQFKWLHAYSPYHNVKDGTRYPAVMIKSGESDTRVHPLHAWKMTARLQAATASDRPILLRMESKSGHGAGKPMSKVIDAEADDWIFLMQELGMLSKAG